MTAAAAAGASGSGSDPDFDMSASLGAASLGDEVARSDEEGEEEECVSEEGEEGSVEEEEEEEDAGEAELPADSLGPGADWEEGVGRDTGKASKKVGRGEGGGDIHGRGCTHTCTHAHIGGAHTEMPSLLHTAQMHTTMHTLQVQMHTTMHYRHPPVSMPRLGPPIHHGPPIRHGPSHPSWPPHPWPPHPS